MGGLWRYDDLVAWDATGRNVPVRLLSQGDGLIVQADTRGASWPVTVEPALTPVLSIETPLTASDGTADDNDCDDVIDPEDSEDATIWYADVDDDGYGAADSAVYACDPPDDTVSDGTDCDDTAGRSEVDRVMGKRLRSGCWRVIGGCHRRTPCPAPIRLSSESA